MRLLSLALLLLTINCSMAQGNDEIEVLKVINNVFNAMRTNDSTLLKSCFVAKPYTSTVFRNKDGETQFVSGDFQRFIDAVGKPQEQVWNEPIWNEKVEIDDDLASVWVDYAFYVDDQFSHCGVDAFHLVRLEGQWKIFQLVDTRRKEGCDTPPSKIPDNQSVTKLNSTDQMEYTGLMATKIEYKGLEAFKVSTTKGNDEDGYSIIKDLDFSNGVIEAKVIGLPKEGAPTTARGFIGIAFRAEGEQYECMYIRPTNSTAENQIRRNHSLQYVSHPEYPWHKLRKEEPKKYETYAPIALGEWTKIRIEVQGENAKLFINDSEEPYLIVNDLKLGAGRSGGVGFWTFSTTEAYFADFKVYSE